MAKRAREEDSEVGLQSSKRHRSCTKDRLSSLSDELLLKVFSFLSVPHLATCQRLSRKYQKLADDGQLWKSHYYNRFVRPRASRLPGLKELGAVDDSLHFASKASRWLDDDHLVKHGGRTDWRRQYKLRHNWAKGSCAVNKIAIAKRPSVPPILVQMAEGVIYMADKDDGLRAWATGSHHSERFAQMRLGAPTPPTSLAVQLDGANTDTSRLTIGFEDGSFGIYAFQQPTRKFSWLYTHEPSSAGLITATAMSWPYVVTMTATQILSLYRFSGHEKPTKVLRPPILLHSLRSQSVWPPLSIQLRQKSTAVTIRVAYALPTYLSGWTVGLQEVNISKKGGLLGSRVASAIDQHYRPLAFSSRPMLSHLGLSSSGTTSASNSAELRHIHSKPLTLSYSHPYLLVSHPDNTLTLYLVTSTAESLSISAGSRLWGHTSAVSGVHVASRGKAVSISRRGDEIRLWELEGGFTSSTARKRLASGNLSVKVSADRSFPRNVKSHIVSDGEASSGIGGCEDGSEEADELAMSRGWIGFDEENVAVLKEYSQGQALVVYDFA
ncbi:hypothetical protein CERZMDRAFT_40362 [Cercospora zeae-maydis SCOH1-5]|uniref:F-box domain-containing protein n=1 Tax=Cercospora zeae-maydis SCOH1-5 TaxID=717836 RepID=A0A6A6FIK8_9PEZI|nr:hypothetical protein CERZMDRAFT_40362 [Cercospora zeae-maydis SCOH1-5]